MASKMYEMSLLPVLREQVGYFAQYNESLKNQIDQSYENFLAFVDSKSSMYEGRPEYDSLHQVYQFTASRKDQLSKVLTEESEDIKMLEKLLDDIEKTGDEAQFSEVARELIEQGDYKTDAGAFKKWIEEESASLNKEVNSLLDDWKEGIEEGQVKELVGLIQAIEEEDEFAEPDEEDFANLFKSLQEQDEDAQEAKECNSESSNDDDCCSTQDFEKDGCCGSKVPCCKSKD